MEYVLVIVFMAFNPTPHTVHEDRFPMTEIECQAKLHETDFVQAVPQGANVEYDALVSYCEKAK